MRRYAFALVFGLSLGLFVAGSASIADAASPCKANCKPLFKDCKTEVKEKLSTAKSLFKAKKAICKALYSTKAARKECAAGEKANVGMAKQNKKPSMQACKSRYKSVQLVLCKEQGLVDECSPAGGFTDELSSSLF